MPFTLAHPAAALPLRRVLGDQVVASALVVGSVVPDLAYFVPGPLDRVQSHSLLGLVWFCVPAGLVAYAAFHALLAPLLDALAPDQLRGRLPESWRRGCLPDASLLAVALSLLVGAVTHLLWDSFTHANGAMVRVAPALSVPLATYEGYTIHVYKLLQHGSTLVGVGLLAYWALRWWRQTSPRAAPPALGPGARRSILAALLLLPVLAGVASGWAHVDPGQGAARQLQLFVGHAVVSAGSALLASLLIVAGIGRATGRIGPGVDAPMPGADGRHGRMRRSGGNSRHS